MGPLYPTNIDDPFVSLPNKKLSEERDSLMWLHRSIWAREKALAGVASVFVGPLTDWARRKDEAKMQQELTDHIGRFGPVHGCSVYPSYAMAIAHLTCPLATARA